MTWLIRKLRDRYDAPSGVSPLKGTDRDVLALCDEAERLNARVAELEDLLVKWWEAADDSDASDAAFDAVTTEAIAIAERRREGK